MGNTASWLFGSDDGGKCHGDYHYNDEATVDLRAQGERYRQRAGEAAKRSHDLLAQSQASLHSYGVDFEAVSEMIFPPTGRLFDSDMVISRLRVDKQSDLDLESNCNWGSLYNISFNLIANPLKSIKHVSWYSYFGMQSVTTLAATYP